jgi:RNA 3'-phosphate cyclase
LDIDIDGGIGEGGGQIARTAVGMAGALGKSVSVRNIRKGRKKPGLMAQHLTGIKLAAEMCDAEVSGLEMGSTEIDFSPRNNIGGNFEMDIGTAGSISLVLQVCLIPAIMAKGRTELLIRGGTDVPWSPPIDYLDLVIVPMLQKMGAGIEISVLQRGFYPAGGGEVRVVVSPSGGLAGLDLLSRGNLVGIDGRASCRNLPDHVATRAIDSALKGLPGQTRPKIPTDCGKGPSTGMSIVLAARFENTILGYSCLGEKGLPAERVGEIASGGLREEIDSGATLDEHATDQMIPFMFLAGGPSRFMTAELTMHAKTNLAVAERFVARRVERSEEKGISLISIS